MDSIPEVEAIRAQLQQGLTRHVKIEISLVFTLLGLSRVEYDASDKEAGARSLRHAQQAADGARRGLMRISSKDDREKLELSVSQAEAAILCFVP